MISICPNLTTDNLDVNNNLLIKDNACRNKVIDDILSAFPPSVLRFFNCLLFSDSVHKVIFASQEYFAKKCRCSTRTIRRAIVALVKAGFITARYRHMKTSIFSISPLVKVPELTLIFCRYSTMFLGNLYPNSGYRSVGAPSEAKKNVLQKNINKDYLSQNTTKSNFEDEQGSVLPKGGAKLSWWERRKASKQREEIAKKASAKRIADMERNHKTWSGMEEIPDILEHDLLGLDQLLGLTLHGKVKLSVYPDEALRYAKKQFMSYNFPIRNKFALYKMFAFQYCEHRGINPLWGMYDALVAKYGLSKLSPYAVVVEKPVVKQPEVKESVFRQPDCKPYVAPKRDELEEIAKLESKLGGLRELSKTNNFYCFMVKEAEIHLENLKKAYALSGRW